MKPATPTERLTSRDWSERLIRQALRTDSATVAATTIWYVKIYNVTDVLQAWIDAGRYPIDAFPPGLFRFIFTFIVPVAFLTTVPARALLGQAEPRWMVYAALLSALESGGRIRVGIVSFSGEMISASTLVTVRASTSDGRPASCASSPMKEPRLCV